MPDTTTPSPPTPSVAQTDLDASVDAMVGGSSSAGARDPAVSGAVISPESLDAVLAETAQELAGAEGSAGDEDFADFTDPGAILGEPLVAEEVDLDAPAPTDEPHVKQDGVVAAETDSTPEGASPTAATDPAAGEPDEPPAPATKDAVFQDPASVLDEVSRELGAAPEQAEPQPQAEAGEAPAEAPAPNPEPAEPAAVASPPSDANDGIEELDHALAADAEQVLATAGETPRIAVAPAPDAVVETKESAPEPPPPAPKAPPAAPVAAPIAKTEPAPPATSIPEAPAEPKPRRSLRPVLARIGSLALGPLVRVNGRLSHTARQTIGYAAIITLFNCTWVWGYVLIRGHDEVAAPAGEGTPFVKPGDPAPGHDGGHSAPAADKPDGHGEAPPNKKKDDGHGSASKKKKDDGHGASSKSSSKAKKPSKKEASAGHH